MEKAPCRRETETNLIVDAQSQGGTAVGGEWEERGSRKAKGTEMESLRKRPCYDVKLYRADFGGGGG